MENQNDKLRCCDCDCEVSIDEALQDEDGEVYCSTCFNTLYTACYGCDNTMSIEDNKEAPDGHYYCQRCHDDYWGKCYSCSVTIACEDLITDNCGDTYCHTCYHEEYTRCCNCGEEVSTSDVCISDYGDNYCDTCYYEQFVSCCDCDCEVSIDEALQDEDGEVYCSACYGGVRGYSYKPNPLFHKQPTEITDLFFGVECEIEAENQTMSSFPKNLDENILYAKSDSSIDSGFEVVSHPLSWRYIKTHDNLWDDMFALAKQGCRSYKTTTCGIHIHLSAKAFGTWQLYKFLKFFDENKEFILKISQRNPRYLEKWASLKSDESITYKALHKNQTKRYVAVNLRNEETVEIRIFRGTLYKPSFFKNLEFCKALFDFTLDKKPAEMQQNKFIAFVNDNRKQYPNLNSFIEEKITCVL